MNELAVLLCRTYKVSWETEVAGDYQITVMVTSPALCVAARLAAIVASIGNLASSACFPRVTWVHCA